jgi:hypothetical protein
VVVAVRCQAAPFQKLCQRLFVFCLVGLGATTMLALTLNNSAWVPCAVAYALLSVAATVDFSPVARCPPGSFRATLSKWRNLGYLYGIPRSGKPCQV